MTQRANPTLETLLLEAPGSAASTRSIEDVLTDPDDDLGSAFVASASLRPENKLLTTPSGSWTSAELLASANDVRRRLLQSRSFAPGSRVLLLLPNSWEYIAAFYGTLLAGGVVVPLAPQVERQQFLSIRQSVAARHLITQPRIVQTRIEMLGDCLDSGETTYMPDLPPGLAVILFTGGSSGTPKGVMLSHRNLIANARSIQQYLDINSTHRPLCVLPFYHAFGNSVLQSHVLAGSQLILDGNPTFPETLIEAIIRHRATSLSGVPDLFRFLLERSSLGTAAMPSLSYLAVAGGSLPHELALQVAAKAAPARFVLMYGQTEATARLAYVPLDRASELGSGCIGRAIPGVELEIVDESGLQVQTGAVGEIRARGPNIMLGYWQDPSLTNEVLRNGWLHTGDLGTSDENGWIYHRGRRNALIKIAGYRIHPSDVEDFIVRNLPVQQAVVVPYESPGVGTRLALFARPNAEVPNLSTWEIVARCRDELPRHMVPDEIQIVDSFPLNDALKIDRPRLITLATDAAARRRKIA